MWSVPSRLQGALDRGADVRRAAVDDAGAAAGVGDEAELRRHHDLVAAALDGRADQFLAVERAVDLGGVDVGDAQVQRAVDGADRLGVVEASADGVEAGHGHGAESDAGDVQTAERNVLHAGSSLSLLWRPGKACRRPEKSLLEGVLAAHPSPATAPSLDGWTTATRSGPSSPPDGPRSPPSRPAWRTTAATGGCPVCAAARSPTWPGSASSTTRSSNAATSPGCPRACSTRSPGPCSSTTPSGHTCLDLARAAGPARRAAAGPRPAGPARRRPLLDGMTEVRPSWRTGASTCSPPTRSRARCSRRCSPTPPARQLRPVHLPRPPRPRVLVRLGTRCRRHRRHAAHRSRPRPLRQAADRPGGELSTRSDEFRVRWAAHDVRLHRTGPKHLHHPVVGECTSPTRMDLPADPGLALIAFSPKQAHQPRRPPHPGQLGRDPLPGQHLINR